VVRLDGVLRRPHGRAGLPAIWDDISTFLDLDRLEFVVTAEPYVVFDRLDGATADVSP